MVRPSYVLGGRGMEVVYDAESMVGYMKAAVGVTPDRPILIDRFLNHATECEADAISDGTHAFVPAVMEHIELAGVHSGDSACIIPVSYTHLDVYKRQVLHSPTYVLVKNQSVLHTLLQQLTLLHVTTKHTLTCMIC